MAQKTYFRLSPHPAFFNRFYFRSRLKKIKKLTGADPSPILDVGCGWGDFLQVVKDNRFPYLGIDVSEEAIKICLSKKLNCRAIDIASLESKQQGKYSAITLFQVIEHLKNPLPVLKSAFKLLKKGGLILLTTPNNNAWSRKIFGARWSVHHTPAHFVFYNQTNLKKLLGQAGFSNIKVGLDRVRFLSLTYLVWRLFNLEFPDFPILKIPIPTEPAADLEAVAFKL